MTNYLVATGIMIPLTGRIATRLGRKRYAGRLDHDELELVCARGACCQDGQAGKAQSRWNTILKQLRLSRVAD